MNLFIVNIYSSCFIRTKRLLWSNLVSCMLKFMYGEWCLGGDFNAVKLVKERKGRIVSVNRLEMDDFFCFIESMEVVDPTPIDRNFSWFSSDGVSISHLDKFLLSQGLMEKWNVDGQIVGSRDLSDHCPI
ncbi:unnamed protein product [Lathyrus sativus]|nr:unnamed protein product [Lathyrus sativus]